MKRRGTSGGRDEMSIVKGEASVEPWPGGHDLSCAVLAVVWLKLMLYMSLCMPVPWSVVLIINMFNALVN